MGIRTLTTQADPVLLAVVLNLLVSIPLTVAYQTFTLQFIDSSEITVMNYQRNDLWLEVTQHEELY